MKIEKIINDYGRKYSPYMGGFINHLPMGQLALYKMTKDLESVQIYSEKFIKMYNIDKIKSEFPKIESLGDALGKPHLYEPALEVIRLQIDSDGIDSTIKNILNKYNLGMSSGLFHTLIRLAYSTEGYQIDKNLEEEVTRALAYYVTAYKEASVFSKKIQGEDILEEMKSLLENQSVQKIVSEKNSLGQKMKSLYEDNDYMDSGFVVDGNSEDKIKSLLKLSINAYLNSGSIVTLHCITGLHALIVLEEYFDDFSKSIDIFTTCIITHMIAGDIRDFTVKINSVNPLSWEEILAKGSESLDVHAIKLTYSAYELYKLYGVEALKDVALKRIENA